MEAGQTKPQARDDELIFNLFDAAMSRPEAQREEFLREVCANNDALLAEVERRVKWETRLKGFLLTPVLARERVDHPFTAGDLVVGRFRILGVAGEGGMGVVYEAMDEKLGQRRALKCPRFEFRKRVSPEALKSLGVTHANVCRVFEVHTAQTATGDVDFLAMEFLDGETLAARLPNAPANWLKTDEGRAIASQICAGLKAVHSGGVIHRDLKPSNIMLSMDAAGRPRAVLMDFGIAQASELFSSQVRGTPSYVAPEVWKGQPATVRSDIYSVGVLLYQMACGRLPFAEGTDWKARLESMPQAPGVGEPLSGTICRCLHPDPQRRFESVSELERELFSGRLWRRVSRRSILRSAAATVAAGVSGLLFKEYMWPSSMVRLAVLAPVKEGDGNVPGESGSELINGFLQGVSSRFTTLRHTRRPLSVVSAARSLTAEVTTASKAHQLFSATHAILCRCSQSAGSLSWSIAMELIDAARGKSLARWNTTVPYAGLAAQLFAWEQTVVEETAGILALRADRQHQTLTPEAYADYVQGLYYARFDYENAGKAIPHFLRVTEAAPDWALGYAGLAEAYMGVRSDRSVVAKAQEAVSTAEGLDSELAQVHLIKARINVKTNLYEVALVNLRKAAELDPYDSEIYIEMAYAQSYLRNVRETETALKKAIAAEPGYFKPHIDAGYFYDLQGQFDEAERQYGIAVTLAPDQQQARLNLADLYIRRGRLADARREISECLKIRRSRGVLEQMGALEERTGHPENAILLYTEAIQMGHSYTLHAALGNAYRSQHQMPEAKRAFERGLELTESGISSYPREFDRLAWRAYYHANLGDVAETRAAAKLAWSQADHWTNVRKLLVLAYDRIGDLDDALGLLSDAPKDLLMELNLSPDMSAALKNDPRFQRFTKK